MFCSSCGKKITEDSKFCKYCGANQTETEDIGKKRENKKKNIYVWVCDYCGKEFDTKEESNNHELYCLNNPNKRKGFFKNSSQRAWFCLWIITMVVFYVSSVIMIKFDESGVKLINNNYLVGFYVFNVLVGINAFLAMIIHSFRGSNKVSLFTSKILIISLIYFLLNTSVFAVEGFKAKNNEEYKNKYYAVITPTPTPVVEVKVTPTVVVKKTVKVNNTQNTNTSIDRNQIECIGPDGKQFKTTMDECKKLNEKWGKPVDYMINCEFPPECGGGTKYMKYSECMKPCTRVSAGTRNNSTSYPPCTIYYPYLKSSSTYYYMSPEECQKQKDRIAAGSTQTIPTSVLPKTTIPTQTVYVAPTTSQAEIEARISKCNSRCRSIRSSAIVDLQREAKALGNASSSWYDSRLNSIYTTYYSCASQCY